MSRVVVALGGNALIRRGEAGSTEVQRRNLFVRRTGGYAAIGALDEALDVLHGRAGTQLVMRFLAAVG